MPSDADPVETTWRLDRDMLEGAAVCCDVTCACEVVYAVPATEAMELALWLWMVSDELRGQA